MKGIVLFFSSILFFQSTILAQKQLGTDLITGDDGSYFGQTVAISSDGNRILIGSDTYNSRTGLVKVYDWDKDSLKWIQVGQDLTGELAETRFGRGADISDDGTTIAIGQWTGDGIVKVFRFVNDLWTQVGLNIDGSYYQNKHGFALELSADGNRIAIGAYQGGYGGELNIYEFDGASWNRLGNFIQGNLDYAFATDNFGWSLGLSDDGTRVIAGGWGNDGPNLDQSNLGHVKVFDLVDSTWVQKGQTFYGNMLNDALGFTVTISGDGNRIVVAAPQNYNSDPQLRYKGYLEVYELQDSTWVQLGQRFNGAMPHDDLGFSASLSYNGDILAFSAPGFDNDSLNTGKVFLYKFDGLDWQLLGEAIQGIYPNEEIGNDIYLSSDGSRIIVSSIKSDRYGIDAGFASVYETGIDWSVSLDDFGITGEEDLSHLLNHTPEFKFHYSHSDSIDLEKLHFQVSTTSDFSALDIWESTLVSVDSTALFSGNALEDGITYYARARAESYGYLSNWASTTFRMNSKPQNPVLLSPVNEPIVQLPIEVAFLKGQDQEGDSLTYFMKLYEDENYSTIIDSAVIKQELPDTVRWVIDQEIPDSIIYYWTVDTFDGFEFSDSTLSGFFQTGMFVSSENELELPGVFELSQNYPNPFNPATYINFSIPNNSDVSLEVYNILGVKVATLINTKMSLGSHTILFDASALSSGVYFYRIETNTHSKTKKMLLLK